VQLAPDRVPIEYLGTRGGVAFRFGRGLKTPRDYQRAHEAGSHRNGSDRHNKSCLWHGTLPDGLAEQFIRLSFGSLETRTQAAENPLRRAGTRNGCRTVAAEAMYGPFIGPAGSSPAASRKPRPEAPQAGRLYRLMPISTGIRVSLDFRPFVRPHRSDRATP
jgi:hypothetical protein